MQHLKTKEFTFPLSYITADGHNWQMRRHVTPKLQTDTQANTLDRPRHSLAANRTVASTRRNQTTQPRDSMSQPRNQSSHSANTNSMTQFHPRSIASVRQRANLRGTNTAILPVPVLTKSAAPTQPKSGTGSPREGEIHEAAANLSRAPARFLPTPT